MVLTKTLKTLEKRPSSTSKTQHRRTRPVESTCAVMQCSDSNTARSQYTGPPFV